MGCFSGNKKDELLDFINLYCFKIDCNCQQFVDYFICIILVVAIKLNLRNYYCFNCYF